jgi:hypothetical protein
MGANFSLGKSFELEHSGRFWNIYKGQEDDIDLSYFQHYGTEDALAKNSLHVSFSPSQTSLFKHFDIHPL